MADKNETGDAILGWIIILVVCALGYFAYTKFFHSDRKTVLNCITDMMEASRGTSLYTAYRNQALELEDVKDVIITDETRQRFGANTMVSYEYSFDGNASGISCALR